MFIIAIAMNLYIKVALANANAGNRVIMAINFKYISLQSLTSNHELVKSRETAFELQ